MDKATLKKALTDAKKKDVAYAFMKGKDDGSHVLITHKTKKPKALVGEAKKKGAGGRVEFGTLKADGNKLSLKPEKKIAGTAKAMTKLFKKLGLPAKVKE